MRKESSTSGSSFSEKTRSQADQGGYNLITTDDLWALYQNDPDLVLVDVRDSKPFLKGRLKGASNFPMTPTWWSRISKRRGLKLLLGPDKNRAVVFY